MAIGIPVQVSSGQSDTDASSYNTASINFVSGRDYFIGVLNSKATTPNAINSITGATSGTWTGLNTLTFGTIASPTMRLSAKTYHATSTFSEALTIDFSGVNQTGLLYVVIEVAGVHATPTLQAVTHRTDTTATETSTLAAFAAGSIGLGFAAVSAQRTFTAGNSYTLLGTVQQNSSPVSSLQALYCMTDNDPNVTWTTNTNSGIIGLEIQAAASTSWGAQMSDTLNRIVQVP